MKRKSSKAVEGPVAKHIHDMIKAPPCQENQHTAVSCQKSRPIAVDSYKAHQSPVRVADLQRTSKAVYIVELYSCATSIICNININRICVYIICTTVLEKWYVYTQVEIIMDSAARRPPGQVIARFEPGWSSTS